VPVPRPPRPLSPRGGTFGTGDRQPLAITAENGRDWRLPAEMFTMLKRTGAGQVITYATAGPAAALG
jgi:hypothetical protein